MMSISSLLPSVLFFFVAFAFSAVTTANDLNDNAVKHGMFFDRPLSLHKNRFNHGDGINQMLGAGWFRSRYHLEYPLGQLEERIAMRLFQARDLSVYSWKDNEWFADWINLEVRDKFWKQAVERFKGKLREILRQSDGGISQIRMDMEMRYAQPLFSDRIFRLMGHALHRTALISKVSNDKSVGLWSKMVNKWQTFRWLYWLPFKMKFHQRFTKLQLNGYLVGLLVLFKTGIHSIDRHTKGLYSDERALFEMELYMYRVLTESGMELAKENPELIDRLLALGELLEMTPRMPQERRRTLEYFFHIHSQQFDVKKYV